MADNSRIEDLRKRYHENPRRFFAPLANEYRKAGFLDRAILLCQKHLAEQPDNMNGLVVFGQALFEAGQLPDAREPFTGALKLDPENLIALRHLGDIARLEGDAETAREWYLKVLELDRRNSEVLDLLQEVGGAAGEPRSGPSARPTAGGGLVSVAPTVGVSGGEMDTRGIIDLDPPAAPSAPPGAPPAPPVKTLVIDAQRLAEQDRREAEAASAEAASAEAASAASAVTVPVVAVTPQAPKPAKRTSLLDIDFSELAEKASANPPAPAAPLLGVEAAEYGFAKMEIIGEEADPPIGLPTDDAAAGLVEPPVESVSLSDAATAPAAPAGDLELADFSAEVSPLQGLEATEFESGDAAPLPDLEVPDDAPEDVPPLADLDRVDVTVDEVAPVSGLEPTMGLTADFSADSTPEPVAEPVAERAEEPVEQPAEQPMLDAELDAIEVPSAEAPISDFASLELPSVDVTGEADESGSSDDVEPPSASVRPRMTRADLASLPLLADFGLDEDEPAAELAAELAAEPAPRASQRTPTFVTETMAELYLQQGFRTEAISVYRQLIAQQPDDAGLRARLAALEHQTAEIPDFETPTDLTEPEPAAANAVLDDVSFGEVGLRVPSPTAPIATQVATPEASLEASPEASPEASGPSAREFFASFARRAAVASAPAEEESMLATENDAVLADSSPAEHEPATTASEWPLDALFGAATDVRDLHAAETLAGMATFEGPDGGTQIDELLSGDAPPARRSVPRVSESLKFDQFFAAPGTSATPTPPATPAADEPGDDDLDQFQDWLKGLKP